MLDPAGRARSHGKRPLGPLTLRLVQSLADDQVQRSLSLGLRNGLAEGVPPRCIHDVFTNGRSAFPGCGLAAPANLQPELRSGHGASKGVALWVLVLTVDDLT